MQRAKATLSSFSAVDRPGESPKVRSLTEQDMDTLRGDAFELSGLLHLLTDHAEREAQENELRDGMRPSSEPIAPSWQRLANVLDMTHRMAERIATHLDAALWPLPESARHKYDPIPESAKIKGVARAQS